MIDLYNKGGSRWESPDGRVIVDLDDTFETECDEPHPMKVRLDTLRGRYIAGGAGERAFDRYVDNIKRSGGRVVTKRTKSGWVDYLAWQCQGGDIHYYSQWTVQVDDDWTDDVYETFQQALSAAEKATGEQVKIRRPRKPKAPERERTFDAVTGAASWARCGHRAELDINEHCYTCGQPV